MGRRSPFTKTQKRDAVLAVLSGKQTVSEVYRELGISAQTFARWRASALEGMEAALADKDDRSRREAELERKLDDRGEHDRPVGVGERSVGKSISAADVKHRPAIASCAPPTHGPEPNHLRNRGSGIPIRETPSSHSGDMADDETTTHDDPK